jgi:hypothetical protein
MGFEQSKFGDGSASGGGNVTTAVNNHYGPRESTRAQGKYKTEGVEEEVSIEFSGVDVGADSFALLAPSVPAGAIVTSVVVRVKEAFVIGGTTPAIVIGTEGSEATNGFVISEAQGEATGTYDVSGTLTGTWAAPLAAATTVGIDMSGTSPTVTDAGLAEVVVKYWNVPA